MTPLTQDVSVLSSLSSESCKELVAKLAMLIRPSGEESSSFIADVPYARSFHAKDVVYATTLPSCDKENDWKKGTQRFVWREMSPEVREVCETLLHHASLHSFPFDCLIVKRFVGDTSVPLLLNHNQFQSEYVAILSADRTARLTLYNTEEKLRYKSPLWVRGKRRRDDMLLCTSNTQKRNVLFLLTSLHAKGHHCDCGGEFCFERILHNPDQNAVYQTKFVDEVCVRVSLHSRRIPPSRTTWRPRPPSTSDP